MRKRWHALLEQLSGSLQPHLRLILGAAVVLIGLPLILLVVWKVPEWQVSRYPTVVPVSAPSPGVSATPGLTVAEAAKQEDEYRRTLIQIIGGLGLFGTLILTWLNINTTRNTALEGQVTDRFIRAIELLGTEHEVDGRKIPSIEARLGGIYALE